MNPYLKNLERIEFVITYACTGRCKHCSQGEHRGHSSCIDAGAALQLVRDVTQHYHIRSLMTFGGEPLLYPEIVCAIHELAHKAQIPKRQLITNGFFSHDSARIREVARDLALAQVNDVLVSVDAFHQETIPLEPVTEFVSALQGHGMPLRMQPAWLVSKAHDNPYNRRTRDILAEFEAMGIPANEGNVIFPSGNACKYLSDYFDPDKVYTNPYEDDPSDVSSISAEPDGSVLDGNLNRKGILQILKDYRPK